MFNVQSCGLWFHFTAFTIDPSNIPLTFMDKVSSDEFATCFRNLSWRNFSETSSFKQRTPSASVFNAQLESFNYYCKYKFPEVSHQNDFEAYQLEYDARVIVATIFKVHVNITIKSNNFYLIPFWLLSFIESNPTLFYIF